jgi:hypothetical protein
MHAFLGCRLWRAVIRLGGYELVCFNHPMLVIIYISGSVTAILCFFLLY